MASVPLISAPVVVIDAPRLAELISDELVGINRFCIETRACIGEYKGRQVHIVITGEEDEFMDNSKDMLLTFLKGKT